MIKSREGFTLIEIVVVMAIIAVLAALVVGAIRVARNTARETTHRSDMRTIQAGIEAYYAKNRVYPTLQNSNGYALGFNEVVIGTGVNQLDIKLAGDTG